MVPSRASLPDASSSRRTANKMLPLPLANAAV